MDSRFIESINIDKEKKKQAYETGKKIVELVKNNITAKKIMTKEAFENAIRVDMAMGGSTNTILHTLAIANEAGIKFDLNELNLIASKTPYLCKVSPATSKVHMEDVDAAGGVHAILNELSKIEDLVDLTTPTV